MSRPDLPDDRIRADGDRVLVLPLRETEEGFGVYAEGTVTLVKQFRALGIDASYLHSAERRLFEGRNGVVADAVVSIVLGVISSAAWDGLKRWFGTRKDQRMKVTFGRVDDPIGSSVRWWQIEGDADSALKAIDRLMSGIDDTTGPAPKRLDGDLPPREPDASGETDDGVESL